jgi:hypothetical protein
MDEDIVQRLVVAYWEAMAVHKRVTLQLLKAQKEKMLSFLPDIEEVEKRLDTAPKFLIVGSRMEIYNVDSELFLEKFPEHFKQLLSSGPKSLVVDISHLKDFSEHSVNLLILSYLEAVGRGLTVTLRIRPEMEESFHKSGRGRALPLEVVRPELGSKVAYREQAKKASMDMKKIQEAADKDRLSSKILHKEFASVHIESRGTVQNWEPAPVKAGEREVAYQGTERRKERRYKPQNLEVCYAKGTLGKIAGRRFPVHNISQSGACFTSAASFAKGEPIRLKIFAQEETGIELSAKIVWNSPVPAQALFRTGVQFTNLSDVAKIQLRDLIAKVYTGQDEGQKR